MQVSGEAKPLTSSPANERVALAVRLTEGPQYRLGSITFHGNKAITNGDMLRKLFPIADGDVFSREKVGKGLESLRKAYADFGYINFTSVPDTRFDDRDQLISLNIDVDEGKQFYVAGVDISGVEETTRQQLVGDFPLKREQAYNGRLFESFLMRHASLFSACACGYQRTLDEKAATVTFEFDFSPCPTK